MNSLALCLRWHQVGGWKTEEETNCKDFLNLHIPRFVTKSILHGKTDSVYTESLLKVGRNLFITPANEVAKR